MSETYSGIKTEELAVGYGKNVVVDDVNIQVIPGRITTLIGPNGSGKSTVLKTISNQLKPVSGTVLVDGQNIGGIKEAQLATKLAIVMTRGMDLELMTCREVVATGRYPYTGRMGILSKDDWDKVDEAIEIVNAKETADKYFNSISDGQKQRVMLARAICQDTSILVLDEPTSFLDVKYKIEILDNLRKMARQKNMAIVMSLHEIDLAFMISDIIVTVNGGKVERVGSTDEISEGGYVAKLYGIDENCFDSYSGNVYFSGGGKECLPKVFVIAGGGCGISTYVRLRNEGVSFATGIVWENDIEYPKAKAMASRCFVAKAFFEPTSQVIMEAKRAIEECDKCICCVKEFGPLNKENELLYEYAKKLGKL